MHLRCFVIKYLIIFINKPGKICTIEDQTVEQCMNNASDQTITYSTVLHCFTQRANK